MRAARFTVITPECIRLEYSAAGRFVDEPTQLAAARPPWNADHPNRIVSAGDGPVTIDTGRIRLEYAPDGVPFSPHNLRATIRVGNGADDAAWQPGQHQRGNLGGALRSLDGVRGPVRLPDGVLSLDGWFLLDDSGTPVLRDGWVAERAGGGGIDWYLFGYGHDYRAALRALIALGGPVPLPRREMLGSWYSRYWPYTSEEYRAIVREYEEHGVPLDVLVLDMDWHSQPPKGSGLPGWTGWSWNRELLPDAEKLLEWVQARGVRVTLNLHPADGVRWYEDRYEAFMRRNGRDPLSRETLGFDAGDRRYMEALLREVHAPLEAQGVDFWWMDWQQEEWARSVRGLGNVGWLNRVYAEWSARDGRRPAPFGRWGGWGDHRHPVHFSGDVHSGWRTLAFVVPFTLRSAGSGCYYWSHDIGGHFGARDEEAMTRWVQFGALSAALRAHSARSQRLDRRPWLCGEPYRSAIGAAYHLRSRLMPTVTTAARACHDEATPLLRPMWLDFPTDERAHRYDGQYLLGDLLVAPIVTPGTGERKVASKAVWFPGAGGGGWRHLETGERFDADSEAIVHAPIGLVPVFVPEGVPIAMQPVAMRMGTEPLRTLVVRCYPGPAGATFSQSVYEDDGATTEYLRGRYARTPISARWAAGVLRLEVGPTVGEFTGQLPQRGLLVEVGGVRSVREARMDGATVGSALEASGGLARVALRERSIRERIVVELEFEAAAAPPHAGSGIAVVAQDGGYRLYDSFGRVDGGGVRVQVVDRVRSAETVVWTGEVSVEPGTAEWIGEPLPQPAPPLGLRADRLVRLRYRSGGAGVTEEHLVRSDLPRIGAPAWRVVGPFRFDHTRSIDDQREGPETGPTDAAATYRGVDGEEVRWRMAHGSEAWPVDLRRLYQGGSIMAYAMTHVWSPVEQQAELVLESGDRIEAWVNRDKVFSMDTGDTMDSASGTAHITLRAGWNRLAVKVSEGGGGFGFGAGIGGSAEVRVSATDPEDPGA